MVQLSQSSQFTTYNLWVLAGLDIKATGEHLIEFVSREIKYTATILQLTSGRTSKATQEHLIIKIKPK